MKIGKLLFVAGIIICSCSSGEVSEPPKKIVYIDNVRLYNEFELTKELQRKMTEEFRAKKNQLDSLEMQVLSYAKQLQLSKTPSTSDIQKFQIQKEDFLMRKQKYEEEQQQITAQYNDQIIVQINQYIKEFGNEKKYDLIVGSNGEGTVMYGTEDMDITDEALSFMNQKYNPGK